MNAARALISLLFIVAMAWLWYPYFMKSTDDGVAQQDYIATPDYIATGLSQTSYNDQGELSHTVYAEEMELYQELGFTHFTKPVFTLYGETENWQVNADEATLYNNNILILENNVTATNLKEGAMIEKVSAEAIQVDIDSQRMESEQAVILSGPNMKITGQGLKADLNTEIVELTEHTRTIYYDQ
ncbi:LPS export ABC transporter periplasmic protein LptC [Pseudoalteromonas ruthenica]|uniref:Lipopolysaccharide export system protein LptC n=1 Tax=Pseudoalteromonas ruthenica TaxID=151081 RepID=A0A0F4Q242_9GAMM|nr:LPS export ABC transporter periplasmic protein LptC [Pseudoalteromonas ruthenica]KJY97696.1 lipopolysaccharide export system protein LptC [Pseudoalteromonas ruthenica]KJZ01723.1 lipopolysaccharide export system protein LptC [Pseudoalteromonas ruthenica]TMO89086.1 LPS export ABC transporter periplasmic protein LptC [Pseudoalteromonas ruthenica]TMO94880.1 LPS export ABC transporter periplasmic protein LptC [Pseudoalteromonas ruthenica]TMO97095.1 LPS export ABC transporter periplasmic protein 